MFKGSVEACLSWRLVFDSFGAFQVTSGIIVLIKADNGHGLFSVVPVTFDVSFAPTKFPSAGGESGGSIGL